MQISAETQNLIENLVRRRLERNGSRRAVTQPQLIAAVKAVLERVEARNSPDGQPRRMDTFDEARTKWLAHPAVTELRDLTPKQRAFVAGLFDMLRVTTGLAKLAKEHLSRPGVTVGELGAWRKIAETLDQNVALLKKYEPVINDFLKLFWKLASVELSLAEALDVVEDDVLRLEIDMACHKLQRS